MTVHLLVHDFTVDITGTFEPGVAVIRTEDTTLVVADARLTPRRRSEITATLLTPEEFGQFWLESMTA